MVSAPSHPMPDIDTDPAPHRKPLLLTFACLGSVSAALFLPLPSSSPIWPVVGLLACAANVGFGASVVAMNSYLPSLARESKEVRQAWKTLDQARQEHADAQQEEEDVQETLCTSDDTLSVFKTTPEEVYNAAITRSTSHISSLGIALGYAAGIVLLILTIIPVSLLHSSTFSLRLAIGMTGIWWAIASVPAGIWLPSGSALKSIEDARYSGADSGAGPWSWRGEIKGAWVRLGNMLRWREIKRLRNTFWYLAAWFLLSDGELPLISSLARANHTCTARLFDHNSHRRSIRQNFASHAFFQAHSHRRDLASLRDIRLPRLAHLAATHRLVGLVDGQAARRARRSHTAVRLPRVFAHLPQGGRRTVWRADDAWRDVWVGGVLRRVVVLSPVDLTEYITCGSPLGLMYGAFQSYSRSLFSFLIPPGEESRWYGLYSITGTYSYINGQRSVSFGLTGATTDKSSSFIGPLMIGLISDVTGNIRYGFFFLAGMMYVALPLLGCVDVERGQEDARRYMAEREDGEGARTGYTAVPRGDIDDPL